MDETTVEQVEGARFDDDPGFAYALLCGVAAIRASLDTLFDPLVPVAVVNGCVRTVRRSGGILETDQARKLILEPCDRNSVSLS